MKELIERIKSEALNISNDASQGMDFCSWTCEVGVLISGNDAIKIIKFYEAHKIENEQIQNVSEYTETELTCKGCMGPCGQCKDEPLPNVPDITPEWDKIDEKYKWCAIDEGGDEFAFVRRPTKLYNHINRFNEWTARDAVFTGRYFDMTHIDWTKTLSKRPAK